MLESNVGFEELGFNFKLMLSDTESRKIINCCWKE